MHEGATVTINREYDGSFRMRVFRGFGGDIFSTNRQFRLQGFAAPEQGPFIVSFSEKMAGLREYANHKDHLVHLKGAGVVQELFDRKFREFPRRELERSLSNTPIEIHYVGNRGSEKVFSATDAGAVHMMSQRGVGMGYLGHGLPRSSRHDTPFYHQLTESYFREVYMKTRVEIHDLPMPKKAEEPKKKTTKEAKLPDEIKLKHPKIDEFEPIKLNTNP